MTLMSALLVPCNIWVAQMLVSFLLQSHPADKQEAYNLFQQVSNPSSQFIRERLPVALPHISDVISGQAGIYFKKINACKIDAGMILISWYALMKYKSQ